MLTSIQIDNFAIIDHLDIDFQSGMTALTGETGAGKSIMIDALSLLLGERADATVVRTGAKRADICARFDLTNQIQVKNWLEDQELDDEGECLLRRVINKEGRSRGFINGHPATLSMLKSLGEMLVDIHGQHAHQALLRPGMQTKLLDAYAGLASECEQVKKDWHFLQKLEKELQQLRQSEQERHDRHELLDYQVRELDDFGISIDEINTIDDEYNRLANTNELLSQTDQQLHLLYDNEQHSAYELIQQATHKIEELLSVDRALSPISELLHNATIQLQEAVEQLRQYQDQIEQDPERLQELDQRLAKLHELARKHRVEVKALPELHIHLHEELSELMNSTKRYDNLEDEVANAKQAYLDSAKLLSKKRQTAAKKLNKTISEYLTKLGMEAGRFEVEFEALSESAYSSEGIEKIRFLVSANQGQAPQPLTKVASGGELSRISLAIQVVTVSDSSIPCLIFDEVDVGIGGGTAEVVGNLLKSISKTSQVLCVTHQAQVASKADQHYKVLKTMDKTNTHTSLSLLEKDQRKEEIARMIGGIKITEQTRKHAEEMLSA